MDIAVNSVLICWTLSTTGFLVLIAKYVIEGALRNRRRRQRGQASVQTPLAATHSQYLESTAGSRS